jgi:transposase-like protein
MQWARLLLSAEDLRKRAEHLRNLLQKASKRQKKKPLKRKEEASAQSLRRAHEQRSDCSSGVLGHACRSDGLQRNGTCRACRSAGLSPHSLCIWHDRLEQRGNEMDWRSLLQRSARAQLSSAANCARCKYRLTPQVTDGRSNRQRFTDEQKRAVVQEKEKPGVADGGRLLPHGIATSRLFRWRAQFGLTARKTPQLATAALTDGEPGGRA